MMRSIASRLRIASQSALLGRFGEGYGQLSSAISAVRSYPAPFPCVAILRPKSGRFQRAALLAGIAEGGRSSETNKTADRAAVRASVAQRSPTGVHLRLDLRRTPYVFTAGIYGRARYSGQPTCEDVRRPLPWLATGLSGFPHWPAQLLGNRDPVECI